MAEARREKGEERGRYGQKEKGAGMMGGRGHEYVVVMIVSVVSGQYP